MSKIIKKSIAGLKWNSIRKIGKTLLNLATTLILVQFLPPDAFGLVAMITVFSGLYILFSDLGLGSSLIQKQNLSDVQISTVYWISVLIGLTSMLVLYFAADYIASFYGKEQLSEMAQLISVSLLLAGIVSIPIALLNKELDFKRLCIIDLLSLSIASLLAIYSAIKGYGVWSLIVLILANAVIRCFVIFLSTSWRPSLRYDFNSIKPLMQFGLFFTSNNVLNYSIRNLDDLLIGKFLGSTELGLYSKAYSLLLMPLKNVTGVFQNVLFPTFSKLQEDPVQIREVYLKSVAGIAFISFPLMIIVYFLAEAFIQEFFTSEWYAIIPLVKLFCLLGLIQSVLRITGSLFLAMNKTKWLFYFNLITSIIFFTGFFMVLNKGLIAIAYWWIAYSLIIGIVQILFSNSIIDLGIGKYLINLIPIILISIVVFILGYFLERQFSFSAMPKAICIAFCVGLTYLVCMHLSKNVTYLSLKRIITKGV